MRIAFFGLPLAACLLHADGHEIVHAALSRNDAIGIRRARRLFGEEKVSMRPRIDTPGFIEKMRVLSPDLVVSWFWTTRIPMRLVDVAPLGGINAHPSLLPRHRGPDPTYWTIREGDTHSGVSVHQLTESYDTGPVLLREIVAVDPGWNAWQLARALDSVSLRATRNVVRLIAAGEMPTPVPQDEALATNAPFPEEEDLILRFGRPTREVLRHIRALAPSPGAFTELGGREVAILSAMEASHFPRALEEPGEAACFGGRCFIRTADGALEVREIEVDGERLSERERHALFGG